MLLPSGSRPLPRFTISETCILMVYLNNHPQGADLRLTSEWLQLQTSTHPSSYLDCGARLCGTAMLADSWGLSGHRSGVSETRQFSAKLSVGIGSQDTKPHKKPAWNRICFTPSGRVLTDHFKLTRYSPGVM